METLPSFNLREVRHHFPMLSASMHGKPLIYLDSAATAQKPQVVIDTIFRFYSHHYSTVHRAVYELATIATHDYHKVREKVRQFLNAAKTEEIIFTRGTTESINLVAVSFGEAFVQEGDEVLISAMEHHSNIVPWQMMCKARGAHLKVIPMNEKGELLLDAYEQLLSPRTRIVALTHLSNVLGTINPVKKMIRMAHVHGAKVLVDGAQSAPHFPVDVQDLDADFFVFSGHKVMGPTGIGVLYGKEELLNSMPPYQGGGDMIETVDFSHTTYNKLPLKFEAGTPLIAEVMGLGAAIDYLQDLGRKEIHRWENFLYTYARGHMEKMQGLRILGNAAEKTGVISFVVEGTHPLDIGTLLDFKGIAVRTGHHCAQPILRFFALPATVRASFSFYNTKEEVDTFIQSLEEVIKTIHAH